jgi:signal transduction histidine kinase
MVMPCHPAIRPARRHVHAPAVSAYPEKVLAGVRAWLRAHPWQADGLLAVALFALSASQLSAGTTGASMRVAYIAVTALLAATVVPRRRYPVAAFAAAAVIEAAQVAYGVGAAEAPVFALQPAGASDLAILVLLYTLAAYRPRPVSVAGLAVCLLGSAVAIARWAPAHHAYAGGAVLGAAAGLGGVTLTAWVLGDSVAYRYRRACYASLEERAARLEAERDAQARIAAAAGRARELEERRARAVDESAARLRRIERDLHDGAQVRLAALALALGEIKENLEPAAGGAGQGRPGDNGASGREAHDHGAYDHGAYDHGAYDHGAYDHGAYDHGHTARLVGAAHQNAKETLAELRDLARGIHPPVLDRGLGAALSTLAEASATPVALAVSIAERPSPAIESIAYFCASELLANVTKHSGASRATVSVSDQGGRLLMTVTDDGAGEARLAPGGGLAGLLERVQTVDGRLAVDSPPGGPTIIAIELPAHA